MRLFSSLLGLAFCLYKTAAVQQTNDVTLAPLKSSAHKSRWFYVGPNSKAPYQRLYGLVHIACQKRTACETSVPYYGPHHCRVTNRLSNCALKHEGQAETEHSYDFISENERFLSFYSTRRAAWAFVTAENIVIDSTPSGNSYLRYSPTHTHALPAPVRYSAGLKIGFQHRNVYPRLTEALYDEATPFGLFQQGVSIVCKGCKRLPAHSYAPTSFVGGQIGMINTKGEVVLPLKYDRLEFNSQNALSAVTLYKEGRAYRPQLKISAA